MQLSHIRDHHRGIDATNLTSKTALVVALLLVCLALILILAIHVLEQLDLGVVAHATTSQRLIDCADQAFWHALRLGAERVHFVLAHHGAGIVQLVPVQHQLSRTQAALVRKSAVEAGTDVAGLEEFLVVVALVPAVVHVLCAIVKGLLVTAGVLGGLLLHAQFAFVIRHEDLAGHFTRAPACALSLLLLTEASGIAGNRNCGTVTAKEQALAGSLLLEGQRLITVTLREAVIASGTSLLRHGVEFADAADDLAANVVAALWRCRSLRTDLRCSGTSLRTHRGTCGLRRDARSNRTGRSSTGNACRRCGLCWGCLRASRA
ncbi:MAG: hypothetical protein EKK44_04070 [Methylobacterium sp.]|nr:MAG: hypothetical protein EKK44_04070 [Methylobacterium sp.]